MTDPTLDQLAAEADAISDKSPRIKQFCEDTVLYLRSLAPAPAPTPTPTPDPLSFNGDFTTGDAKQWTGGLQYDFLSVPSQQFQVVSGAQYPQGKAGEFRARQAYSPFGWNESCEALQPWTDTGQGSHFFYGWHVTFPQGTVPPRGWMTILQWYTQNFSHFAGPAPVAIDGGSNKLIANFNTGLYANGGYAYNHALTFDAAPVYDDVTRSYIFEALWSKDADGKFVVYALDGTQLGGVSGVPTLRYDPAYNNGAADPIGEQKIGVYRQSWCTHDASGNIFNKAANPTHIPGTCALGTEGSQPDTIVRHGFWRGDSFESVAAHFA